MLDILNSPYLINAFNSQAIYKKIKSCSSKTQKQVIKFIINKNKLDDIIKLLYKYNTNFDYRLELIQLINNERLKESYFNKVIAEL